MGSVSSLISGHSLHSKHSRSVATPRKGLQGRKSGRGLDSLLKHGFAQDSSANNNTKVSYRSGKSEDFLYIKVSNNPKAGAQRSTTDKAEEQVEMGQKKGTLPELVPVSGKLDKSAEKALIRPTAFKPVLPRSSSSLVETHNNLSTILGVWISPIDRQKESQEPKQESISGTLSDSGRNSMSSLPTHSTSGSSQTDNLSTCIGHPQQYGGTSPNSTLQGGVDPGSLLSEPSPTKSSASGGGVRSPISTDESLIQQLERQLLDRESELAELQTCFEEKEWDTCQLFEENQRYCVDEMTGLKQRCSTKLRQVSQRALQTQQVLQQQVLHLQQEVERLQEEVERLTQAREAAENQLRSYKNQQDQLAPTLEETQWEVCQKAGEISLLKQQLKESQGDVVSKLAEIIRLKASLRDARTCLDDLQQKTREYEEALRSQSTEVEVCQNELQRKKSEAEVLRDKVAKLQMDIRGMKQDLGKAGELNITALHKEVERLREQLKEEKEKKDKMISSFQEERQIWNTEKDRVIRYQKQLQYNYLQMHRKNQALQKILRDLTAELENRAEQDLDPQSPDLPHDSVTATEI
uniref:Uncharacterized protein n=1 Tax=Electrophorus electricus TaxID=8005 RepID=A0A4W4HKX1_ELEEL